MISRPVIFISAVSKELRGARDLVAATLTSLGYEPAWQDFAGDLRRRVDESAAVIQLLGQCYGDELPQPDAEFGRVSCTQYEALSARQRGKKVWSLVIGRGHPVEPGAPAEPDELRKLQEAYRRQVQKTNLCFDCANLEQTRTAILQLRGRLPKVQRAWKQPAAYFLLLLGLTAVGVWRGQHAETRFRQEELAAEQALAAPETTPAQPEAAPAAGDPTPAPPADLSTRLGQVQEALSVLQQNADPKSDPIGRWPPERLERELAGQLQMKVSELRAILEAGRTSLDTLGQGQALLAAGKAREAAEKFDAILQQKQQEKKRLRQAYAGKAQIAFAALKFDEALPLREKAAALVDQAADPVAWEAAQFWIAYLDRLLARYRPAELLLQEIVALRKRRLGPNHPDYADALNQLALVYLDTNRLREAEPMLEQIRIIYERRYGLEHARVASSLGNLAIIYQSTNRLAEAEPLLLRALQINDKILGSGHPAVAANLNNLAQLYMATDRRAEAEPLMKRVLSINEQAVGPEHPKVAVSLNNLAQLYQAAGRRAEAEPLMDRALKIAEKSFGPEHPDVAVDLNNLANLYLATNRFAEAGPLLERALRIDEKTFGPAHPSVAATLSNLGGLYRGTNRLAEAEPLFQKSLKIREQSFGFEHPEVANALGNLAELYLAMNRLPEAEPRARRAVEIGLKSSQAAGRTVGNVRTHINNYGGLLRKMGVPASEVPGRIAALGQEAGLTPAETQALLVRIIGRPPTRDGGRTAP